MSHWTNEHIKVIDGEWVAFDEAGLEHGRYPSEDDARDALVIHAAVYLSEAGEKYRQQIETAAVKEFANEVWDEMVKRYKTLSVFPLTMATAWVKRRYPGEES